MRPIGTLELCYDGESLIGFYTEKLTAPNTKDLLRLDMVYIMGFYVLPEYCRKGYGKQMYSHLEELLISDGAKGLYLTSDPRYRQTVLGSYEVYKHG